MSMLKARDEHCACEEGQRSRGQPGQEGRERKGAESCGREKTFVSTSTKGKGHLIRLERGLSKVKIDGAGSPNRSRLRRDYRWPPLQSPPCG